VERSEKVGKSQQASRLTLPTHSPLLFAYSFYGVSPDIRATPFAHRIAMDASRALSHDRTRPSQLLAATDNAAQQLDPYASAGGV